MRCGGSTPCSKKVPSPPGSPQKTTTSWNFENLVRLPWPLKPWSPDFEEIIQQKGFLQWGWSINMFILGWQWENLGRNTSTSNTERGKKLCTCAAVQQQCILEKGSSQFSCFFSSHMFSNRVMQSALLRNIENTQDVFAPYQAIVSASGYFFG